MFIVAAVYITMIVFRKLHLNDYNSIETETNKLFMNGNKVFMDTTSKFLLFSANETNHMFQDSFKKTKELFDLIDYVKDTTTTSELSETTIDTNNKPLEESISSRIKTGKP